ncbi:MAG: homocysteine S-methyltransferase family protein [Phycisphaerales bacterium]|nr:homocysteine S-methyltransferase family protein [Phycisphaerales bacterium]
MTPTEPIRLLDGATGSELERRGVDVSLPLWSARAIRDAPDILAAVHADSLDAGADLVTANTFRTHARSLRAGGCAIDAATLTGEAVAIARAARDRVRPDALVYGSVAPLEDCYEPDRAPDGAAARREHDAMIRSLLDAGVDGLLIETMGAARELVAVTDVARRLAPDRWMVSVCCRADGPRGVLLDGTPLDSLASVFAGAAAVGVNCVAAPTLVEHLRVLGAVVGRACPLVAYANVGRVHPVKGWENTDAVAPERYAAYAATWREAGATIIGGCCGTTPATIRALATLRA